MRLEPSSVSRLWLSALTIQIKNRTLGGGKHGFFKGHGYFFFTGNVRERC